MCRGLMIWGLINVSHLHMRNGFGRPQGPTVLCIEQPFNVLQERLLLLQPGV